MLTQALVRTRIMAITARLGLCWLCWAILVGAHPPGLLAGIPVAIAATLLANRLIPPDGRLPSAWRVLWIAPGFLWRSFTGGVDVARRVFDPRLPLKPGWIECRSTLHAGVPRVVASGEISLLPGTLVAGSRGDRLLVHCLDTNMEVARQVTEEENRLRRVTGDD